MSPHTCVPCVRSIQLRQKKVTKEKATPSLRPLRCATGQTCGGAVAGCAVELALRWRAPLGQPRRVRSRSMGASTPMPPHNRPAAGAASRGLGSRTSNSRTATRAIAALGPACAARGACAREMGPSAAQRSNGPRGSPLPGFPSGCAEERRFWRIRARVCLSDAKRREFSETPPKQSTAGCPQRSEGTQRVGSPSLW